MKTIHFLIFFIIMNTSIAQNAGEILFSSAPINPEQPSDLKTEFKTGDKLYAVAYLPKMVKDFYSNSLPNPKLEVEVFIYETKPSLYSYQEPMDEQLTFASMWVSGKMLDNKYLLIDILPDPANTNAYGTPEIGYKEFGKKFDGPVNFAESMARLTSGNHNMKVLVKCYYNDVAQGNFAISGDDFTNYNPLSKQLNDAAIASASKSAVFPKALMSNPGLESKMIAAYKGSNDWKTGFIDATEVLKISIIDADWYVRRHELSGAILHRYIRAAIAVKTRDGKCAYSLATFQEDYAGGSYQPLHYDGVGDKIGMDCANLK